MNTIQASETDTIRIQMLEHPAQVMRLVTNDAHCHNNKDHPNNPKSKSSTDPSVLSLAEYIQYMAKKYRKENRNIAPRAKEKNGYYLLLPEQDMVAENILAIMKEILVNATNALNAERGTGRFYDQNGECAVVISRIKQDQNGEIQEVMDRFFSQNILLQSGKIGMIPVALMRSTRPGDKQYSQNVDVLEPTGYCEARGQLYGKTTAVVGINRPKTDQIEDFFKTAENCHREYRDENEETPKVYLPGKGGRR